MCHSSQSQPPSPPVVTPTEDHGEFFLSTAAGVRSVAYEAHPAAPSRRGVVILPDVRGAHEFYRRLAVRFAEAGLHAVVVDYYGHLTDDPARDDDFDWQAKLPKVDPATVQPVVAAALDALARHKVRDAYTVGFCFGGSQSWLLSASDLPLAGVVGFYGNPDLVQPELDRLHRPMLLLVAGADVATSRDRSEQFERDLTEAGVPHQQQVYDGAPHSFFDRSASEWAAASRDAWERVLAFIAEHATPASGDAESAQELRAPAYTTLERVLPDLGRYAREFAHETVLHRSGLSRRDRELVVLGALIALGDSGRQLRAHAAAAREQGVTAKELGEVVLQALPYAGFPRTINAALGLANQLDPAD
ncbi:dienelactone hydrolase family protein [Flexivirga meconopsidis]|uniref:dienelactone hydrolase family protein n=1 Tax=Flexivirga meconopsidis TaxID=2977121 RepID=UPI00224075E2|nr:dienelactone hydrolase family protein [Flexivirga meconopsidis]